MSVTVTYVANGTFTGAYDDGTLFDIEAALTAGSGSFQTSDDYGNATRTWSQYEGTM